MAYSTRITCTTTAEEEVFATLRLEEAGPGKVRVSRDSQRIPRVGSCLVARLARKKNTRIYETADDDSK